MCTQVAPGAPGKRREPHVLEFPGVRVTVAPVRDVRPVRGNLGVTLEARVTGHRANRPARDVQHLYAREQLIARRRRLLANDHDALAVLRPADGRDGWPRRQAGWQRPRAAGQTLRLSACRWHEPQMRRPYRLGDREIVVTDAEGGPKLVFALELGFGIGYCVRDAHAIRAPRELRHAVFALGELQCITAVHRQHEELSILVRILR